MELFLFFPSRFLGENLSCKEYGCSYIKDGSPDEVYCFRDGDYQAEAGDEISNSRLLSLLPYPTLLEIEHHTSSGPEWDQYIALLGITRPGGDSSSAELNH